MKTLRKTLMTLLALSCLHANAQVSLDECIKSAFDNYPQIEEMDLIKASEGYDLKNAAMAWLPQLSISAKASWQSDVVEMPFSIPGMEIKIPHDQYGVTADQTQQIWDGGAAASKSKQIKAGAEVKRKQLEVNLYSIKSKVQSIYLGIILLDKQIELNDVLETNLWRNLEEVKASAEGGVAGKSDIDQIRVNLLSCEQQKAGLMEDRKAYVRMLGLLTGKDLTGQTLAEPQLKADSSMDIKRPELALYDAQALQTQAQDQSWSRNNTSVRSDIKGYRIQLAQKEDQLAKCHITAPVSGTVLTKYAEAGENVTVGKPVFKIADLEHTYVRAYFSTSQLAGMKIGDSIKVIPDDGSRSPKQYEGRVTWISDQAEFTPKNIQTRDERAEMVYAVKVAVPNDGSLRLGMYAYLKK